MYNIIPIEKAEAVSFDLDSTLANTLQRQWMISQDKSTTDWIAYSMACIDDEPGPALPLAQYLTKLNVPIVICSARSKEAEDLTRTWLAQHGVYPWAISMDDGSHNGYSHGMWKANKLLELQERIGRKIAFHVDDWSDVAKQTAIIGIPTMLVHQIGSSIVDEALV